MKSKGRWLLLAAALSLCAAGCVRIAPFAVSWFTNKTYEG
jgi:hypothetical protein